MDDFGLCKVLQSITALSKDCSCVHIVSPAHQNIAFRVSLLTSVLVKNYDTIHVPCKKGFQALGTHVCVILFFYIILYSKKIVQKKNLECERPNR